METLSSLHSLVSCITDEASRSKEIMYRSIEAHIQISLQLFSVYISDPGRVAVGSQYQSVHLCVNSPFSLWIIFSVYFQCYIVGYLYTVYITNRSRYSAFVCNSILPPGIGLCTWDLVTQPVFQILLSDLVPASISGSTSWDPACYTGCHMSSSALCTFALSLYSTCSFSIF